MNSFQLLVRDSSHSEMFEDVTSFVGEDDSGSFGIKAGHARLMASLVFGLARFQRLGGQGMAQIILKHMLFTHFLAHVLGIELKVVAAILFGAIHCCVSILDQ